MERLVRDTETGTILVYCATRRAVEEVAEWLGQSHQSVGYYHAGLSDEERQLVHDEFRRGTVRILAATNAFGMGIDKSDVRLVVHFDIPGSVEAYYQEVGRAGRDGQPAACVLLFHERDLATQEYFIQQASKEARQADRAERMKTLLQEMLGYVSVSTCRQLAILDYFSDDAERALGPCGLCDRCVVPSEASEGLGSHDDADSAKAILETVVLVHGAVRRESNRRDSSRKPFESDAGIWRGRLSDIRNLSSVVEAVHDRSGEGSDRLRISSGRRHGVSHARCDAEGTGDPARGAALYQLRKPQGAPDEMKRSRQSRVSL